MQPLDERPVGQHNLLHDPAHIEDLASQLNDPARDPTQIQQVIQKPGHECRLALDDRARLRLGSARLGHAQFWQAGASLMPSPAIAT
jgi:hypothetical protein